jgi:hypothetical protein
MQQQAMQRHESAMMRTISQRSSQKTRDELLVLMRPTVLRTPELAALQAKTEEARLPGIAHAESEDNKAELKQVQAEERVIQLQDEKDAKAAFRFLPSRARLDLAGWPETDIFEH